MAKQDEPNKVIYSMVGVGKVYGTKQVLKDIYLGYFYGAKIGVIGLNGSGKTTLLRIMAGVETSFQGQVACAPGYTVGYLEQEPSLDESKTVLEAVRDGAAETVKLLEEFEEISERFAEPMDADAMDKLLARQGEVQERLDALDAWDLDSRLELAMDALRCPPGDTPVKVLSGGERRRVALCRLLLVKPDILLLDEPTNHLDAETVAWLEQHLQKYEGTVIAVTHDRYFLDNVAGWILELDRGQGIPWKGNYSSWLEQKQEKLRTEQKQESERQKTLQRELEWIHMAPKARHAKGKARINAYQQLLTARPDEIARDLEIYIPPGPRLGDLVIEAKGLAKGFGDKLLMEDVEFALPPGAIVGVIGPNGAGKTTLLNVISGFYHPQQGRILYEGKDRTHLKPFDVAALGIARTFQNVALFKGMSVLDNIMTGRLLKMRGHFLLDALYWGPAKRQELEHRAAAERVIDFLEIQAIRKTPAGRLPYGLQKRVELARALAAEPTLLLLDEPMAGMNVEEKEDMSRFILDVHDEFGTTITLIEHDMSVVMDISDRVVALDYGRKIADGPPDAVRKDQVVIDAYLGVAQDVDRA
jgi:ATP-binding cassette ChvD family protein